MKKLTLIAVATGIFALSSTLNAQHGHLNVGVMDTNSNGAANSGDKLGFKNGNDWAYDFVNSSGYVHTSAANTNITTGNIAAYYGGTASVFAITPTALSGNSGRRATINTTTGAVTYSTWENFSATSNGSGAVAGAATGSFLRLDLVSVERLSGTASSFSFWGGTSAYPSFSGTTPAAEWTFDANGVGTLASGSSVIDLTAINTRIGDGMDTTFPGPPYTSTYPNAFTTAQTAEGYRWNVASGDNVSTAVDPYGHIHGRSWATDDSGSAFKLTWQAVDANGVHTSSDQFTMQWQSIPEPGTIGLIAVAAVGLLTIAMRRRKQICGN